MRVPPGLFIRGGKWYARKVVRGYKNRESTGVKVGGDLELKKAIQRQRELEKEWDSGQAAAGKVPTFAEWWATYEKVYSSKKANPQSDVNVASYVLPKWGRIKLNHISKSMCEAHLDSRAKVVQLSTVGRERSALQAMFSRAIEDRLIEFNPFKGIKKFPQAVRTRVLLADEQALLMAVLRPREQRWLTMMLGTGLRLAEGLAVRPEHLDRSTGLLTVQAEAAKYGKGRQVPLYPEVVDAVDSQWATGKMWPQAGSWYRDLLKECSEGLKIPHVFPHALRHTYATRYLQAGGDVFMLSKILGHASVTMTEKQYVHLVSGDLVRRSAGLDLGLSTRDSKADPPAESLQIS